MRNASKRDMIANALMVLAFILAIVIGALATSIVMDAIADESSKTQEPARELTVEDVPTLVSEMTLHDKISQMFVVYRSDAVQSDNETYNFDEYPYGGILYCAPDVSHAGLVSMMLENDQTASDIPLFTCIDEEGGVVARVAKAISSKGVMDKVSVDDSEIVLKPTSYYSDDGADVAYKHANMIGTYLGEIGFNWDNAPVADIKAPESDDDLIGLRCYSADVEEGSDLVAAATRGFSDAGIMTSLKHFPGHGSATDSHDDGVSVTDKTFDQIVAEDLEPFRAGIEAGATSIMLGHLIVPDFDSEPASTSSKWVNYIREDMGYDGLIITDAMNMRLVSEYKGIEDVGSYDLCARAVDAGVDIICGPTDAAGQVDSIEAMVLSGEIDEAKIDAAVTRILTAKIKQGIL